MIDKWVRMLMLLCCCLACTVRAEVRHYLVDIEVLTSPDDYYAVLLKLILNASKAPDEVIDLRFSDHQYSQARWIAQMQMGKTNGVMWTVTNKDREQLLRPIRVPMFKGLLGQRVLVIRKEDAGKFAKITTKAQLAELVAGQGVHWPDTDILMDNGMQVMVGAGKESLYKMMSAKRFDYFPRSVTEVSSEQDLIAANELMVEPRLLISYPTAMYFFVNRQNTELATRLDKGWEIILKNGEFDRFFYNHPRVKSALREVKHRQRIVIELDNDNLPESTPINDSRYWLDIKNVK